MNQVTIVMYHYVRELKKSKYPKIKGLELDSFKEQIKFFQRCYQAVTMEEVIDAAKNNKRLAKNSLLLTFDDGYRDHFENVVPVLQQVGWQGSFFPPAISLLDQKVLDVNKIHFVLAGTNDIHILIKRLFALLKNYRKNVSLLSDEAYYKKAAQSSRYDDKDTMFVKRMLQKYLPLKVREQVLNTLFKEIVAEDEHAFARELYVNIDELKAMRKQGMFIGGHGHDHKFLDSLKKEEQIKEIDSSMLILEKVGASTTDWVMCYPYGAYDQSIITMLKERNCCLGLTLKVGIANLKSDSLLELPRLDTNDFPVDGNAPLPSWTKQIQ